MRLFHSVTLLHPSPFLIASLGLMVPLSISAPHSHRSLFLKVSLRLINLLSLTVPHYGPIIIPDGVTDR